MQEVLDLNTTLALCKARKGSLQDKAASVKTHLALFMGENREECLQWVQMMVSEGSTEPDSESLKPDRKSINIPLDSANSQTLAQTQLQERENLSQ